MYEFENSIFINRPPQDVFNVIIDLDKQPLWQSMVESAKFTSNGPIGVGSTMKAVARFLGREFETEIQVTAWDPPHRIDWKILNGPYPAEVSNTIEPQGEGALLTSMSRAEFGGFFKLAAGLVGKQLQKQIGANYDSLKLLMESNQL